jgi:hypothetical protein
VQKHSNTSGPARIRYTPGAYLVGSQRFAYDADDDQSRHEAHEAACEALRALNDGVDPLAERLGVGLYVRDGLVSRRRAVA